MKCYLQRKLNQLNMQQLIQFRCKQSNIRILSLFLLFFFSTSILFAQTGTITGNIVDAKTKEKLVGAIVEIDGMQFKTVTDNEGNFKIKNVPAGVYRLNGTYISYKTFTSEKIVVRGNDTTKINLLLEPENSKLDEVFIVAKANRESENVMLMQQKKSLVSIQNIGAKELSRKGISDAEGAISKVSGISKQEGVKNVFIRGLGDRYNATMLNGMPVTSEDPEYKNIALEIFGTDIIQKIGVSKVFTAKNGGDVGGAVIDIFSKEMNSNNAFGIDVSSGINTQVFQSTFIKPSGANYFGFTNSKLPLNNKFDFSNSLDPSVVKAPINHSYKVTGGEQFKFGKNTLSVLGVFSNNNDFNYTKETVRNTNTSGVIYQDQSGHRYSNKISQLALANVKYNHGKKYSLAYNLMALHSTNQYIGEYVGLQTEKHQDSDQGIGFLRRQQINSNLLITHQLLSKWLLSNKVDLIADFSINTIKGLEPDRRENFLSKKNDGTFGLTGSNRQKRFFSELNENNFNAKLILDYKIGKSGNSNISFGYNGFFSNNNFNAIEYNFSAAPGSFNINQLALDNIYNATNYTKGHFTMTEGNPNKYKVTKNIHSSFIESSYQITKSLVGNIGLRFDYVDMKVMYDVVGHVSNSNIKKAYYLPSLNLKYNLNNKNALRLGISKTYTLPQSKEISPFQYVNISFASEGNPNLKPSDNYNFDLKWDNYISSSEIISAAIFYKHISNPIGRVDKGNSAGLLTYDNISNSASISGIEIELRKDLSNFGNAEKSNSNKISIGLNASYIFTTLNLNLTNTPVRKSGLEGASPFILNTDITYTHTKDNKSLITSLVLNYFSNRIFTIGTLGFKDIIEKGVPTMDFVSSYYFNKKISIKLKAANLLNPSVVLMRESSISNDKIILNEYKKGMNISIGFGFNL